MKVNAKLKEIRLKLVYYGPGLSGKTTNLKHLHDHLPDRQRGKLIQLDTETERTLFFDYFPMVLRSSQDYAIKVDYFTVPGQSFYQATRRAVLEGADGVIFVADSSPGREESNLLSWEDLLLSLEEQGRTVADLPLVFQWNKRDVDGAVPVSVLERSLNRAGAPAIEAVASRGDGVVETHETALRLLVERVLS